MKRKTLSILVAAAGLGAGTVSAADLYLVASPGLAVTADDVRDIFIGEKQMAGSTKVVPLDNAAAQKDFLARIMSMDAGKYGSLWAKKGFRDGVNPPATKATDAEVISAVKAMPGAVGYVLSTPGAGVTVLRKY